MLPLAHRLGLYNIKTQLEDLGLKYTEPPIYNDIVSKIKRDQRPTRCLHKNL
jgi:GTP pyrophosphokinase